nr:probable phospholipid hydroperoxide glutathione peroxidase [Tanacetum cinerariifolium]
MGCNREINDMLRIKLREAGSNEEIFTFVAWIRAFNINEPIYTELCHEFYSTYEFDEVYADDELQTKKIIKFRLGGRAHNLTLLEFARRLGLYHGKKLDEEGFNVYFEGGLHSDVHFNAPEYWLSISQEENLSLSRSHTSTIKSPIVRVIHKIITYGLCQRTNGYDKIQKNNLWLLSMFDARHRNGYANVVSLIARKSKALMYDVKRSLNAPIYCRDLDTTTLRDLIDYEGRLIPEDPQPGDRDTLEVIEWMEYWQQYHWDRYEGVFEHMDGVYSVPLQGAYNPPGYAQPQYDQYYQQYPLLPPQKTDIVYTSQIDVNGPFTAPLYQFLKSSSGGLLGDLVKGNFEKFLVDKNGKVVERYLPTTSPLQIENDIKKLVAA